METLIYLSLAVFVLSVILIIGIFLVIKLYDLTGDLKDMVKRRDLIIEDNDYHIEELLNQLEAMALGKDKEPLVVDKDLLTVCDRAGLTLSIRYRGVWTIRLYQDMQTIFEARSLPSLNACTKAAIDYLNNRKE